MHSYTVRIPIAGYIDAYVSADSEEEAINKALLMSGDEQDADLFYEPMKHITQGNVFYGSCNEVEITLEDDNED